MTTITWNYNNQEIYVEGTWSKGFFHVFQITNPEEDKVYDLCMLEDDINSNY